MAYLGQGAEGNFTTTNAKDTFSGDGSTATFTLSQRGTENNVDVFVNNVRQEPNVAYNIEGNGTSLVFTAAPSSGTNNIYVVNRGPAELSASHPATQNLEAVDGTFTGDLTVNRSGDGVGLSIERDGVERFTISVSATDNIKFGATTGGGAGLEFFGANGTSPTILPVKEGTTIDNEVDLGRSAQRFQDLFLGGGVYVGGTGGANRLDDYEEGTWTATTDQGTLSSSSTCKYIKVGNLVTVTGLVTNFSNRTSTGVVIIRGLPFASGSSDIAIGAVLARYINAPGDPTSLYLGADRSYLAFYNMKQGTNYDQVRHADLNSSSANFHFTVTYRAA